MALMKVTIDVLKVPDAFTNQPANFNQTEWFDLLGQEVGESLYEDGTVAKLKITPKNPWNPTGTMMLLGTFPASYAVATPAERKTLLEAATELHWRQRALQHLHAKRTAASAAQAEADVNQIPLG